MPVPAPTRDPEAPAPTVVRPTAAPVATAAPPTVPRPEIQALRFVAVGLVVVYHLWPAAAPGGFVGVDVFFAISGFLITSLLLREIDRTGTLSLTGFWGRRARRILPAALVTLLACAVTTMAFVPLTYWPQFFSDLRASTGYVQNWHLAATAVDYFAAENAPSPVQHFWSLSVEEQFYLGWPVMMLCAMVVARGRSLRAKRVCVAVAMAALTLWSLRYSLRATAHNPGAAYFITSTRAWEFGAGGLLAMAGRSRAGAGGRAFLSWIGIAAITVAGALYTVHTPFPGSAAMLPVAGTLAVIHAGAPRRRWAPTGLFALGPVQFFGDISYAIYLWHWPLLILAPFVVHHAVDTSMTLAVLVLTILLSWISKRLIEDPVRSGRFLISRPFGWTLAAAAGATALVMAVDLGGTSYVQARIHEDERATQRILASAPRCFGAAAHDPARPCSNPALSRTVVPSPIEAPRLGNEPCASKQHDGLVSVCRFGAPTAGSAGRIALIGDSHASHWRAALDVVARSRAWAGVSLTRTSCPLSGAAAMLPEPARTHCLRWNRAVPAWLSRHPEVTTAFVVAHTGGHVADPAGVGQFAAQEQGFIDAWKALPPSVRHIVVIRDTPKMRGDTLACVERAIARGASSGPACAVPRGMALQRDPAAAGAARLRSPRVQPLDLTSVLCDPRRCWPVIGGALVYKDIHHLTAVFSSTLGPILGRDVDRLMGTWEAAATTGS
ncbi:acyltransferase family protein [Baekduia soli]|uniref:acyltransferase family protein n=1 Tax=Baekduia soli TaxID=496014 RepID=UPI001651FADD|nr:acyltransferase family protein [Baekduia soli]